jgi:hypothetical protein
MHTRTKTLVLSMGICLAAASTAWADYRMERTLALEPGGTFTLDTDVGEVLLTGDAASGARVLVTSDNDLDDRFEFRFDESGRDVRVTVKRRGLRRLFDGWSDDNTRFVIQVPSKTTVRIGTSGGSIEAGHVTGAVELHTSGGNVRVTDIAGNVQGTTSGGGIRMRDVRGDVIAQTSGGSIVVADVRGTLRADTSGGGINIDAVSGDVRASTSGGSVDVRAAGGRVEAHSTGGPVVVRFAPGNSRGGTLSSSGGSVRTELDPNAKVSIDASSSGGDVNADLPVTIQGRISRDSLRGDVNGGGATLRLRSSGGGIRIVGAARSVSR